MRAVEARGQISPTESRPMTTTTGISLPEAGGPEGPALTGPSAAEYTDAVVSIHEGGAVGTKVKGPTWTASQDAVLLIAARNPTGRRTGRIAVLESAVRGLQAEGAQVHIAAITTEDGAGEWLGCTVTRIAPPPIHIMGIAAIRSVFSGRTLNQAIFDSSRIRQRIRELADQTGSLVVVADSIRTWDAATSTGLPVIAHLDDLLSERYSSAAFAESNDSILGYFSSEIHPRFRPCLEVILKNCLTFEARRAAKIEVEIARIAAVPALTSDSEASELASRAGAPVVALPMAVDPIEATDPSLAPDNAAVFLGVLHYGPNLAALRFLRDEVLPELVKRGITLHVDVIGHAEASQQEEFAGSSINFRGYAPDLRLALSGHRLFLSPILSGTGVKTKVLDAMSVGLPVVATTLGVAGIPVKHGVSAFIADDAHSMADVIEELHSSPERARHVGDTGRTLLNATMSTAIVNQAWRTAYRSALSKEP